MAGYYNFSMSNNAVAAYDEGEMPLSYWTKSEILERCEDKADMLSVLTKDELKRLFLNESTAHHTSKFYNYTTFYAFDEEALEDIDEEQVRQIIKARPPREKPQKKEPPQKITAEVAYNVWSGTRAHPKCTQVRETISYLSNQKLVRTSHGNKRRSSLCIINVISKKG